MARLDEILPELAGQLEQNLRTIGRNDLAIQIVDLDICRWTNHRDEDAGFIYVESRREPSLAAQIEQNVIRPFHEEAIELEEIDGWVLVDVNTVGRITGIEILHRQDIFDHMAKVLPIPLK